MPPRLNPIAAPSTAAVTMVPGEEPAVLRERRAEVYAIAKVQKASRMYMRVTSCEDCLTGTRANCRNVGATKRKL